MRSRHEHGSGVDNLINVLKDSLKWAYSSPAEREELVQSFDAACYQAAQDLIALARQNRAFSAVFSYWHAGELNLELNRNRLVSTHDFATTVEYEVDNTLMGDREDQTPPPEADEI